jgi:hypothetical protein
MDAIDNTTRTITARSRGFRVSIHGLFTFLPS